jgi:hypothetical protein
MDRWFRDANGLRRMTNRRLQRSAEKFEGFHFEALGDRPACKYMPDFYFPELKMWAEAESERFSDEEEFKLHQRVGETRKTALMLEGAPDLRLYPFVGSLPKLAKPGIRNHYRIQITGPTGIGARAVHACTCWKSEKKPHEFGMTFIFTNYLTGMFCDRLYEACTHGLEQSLDWGSFFEN